MTTNARQTTPPVYDRTDRSGMTYDWNGNFDMEIQEPSLSDYEVARRVRMLMRQDWDHESVCTLARDRIMGLSKEVARLRAALKATGGAS